MTPAVKLALVDDHKLIRKCLTNLIEIVSKNSIILFEAVNEHDLQKKIDPAFIGVLHQQTCDRSSVISRAEKLALPLQRAVVSLLC